MALSFEESKKNAAKTTAMPMRVAMNNNMSVYADESWQKPRNASFYTYYDNEYHDDKLSTVDENKNVTLSDSQINLTQEKNSQYIPFEIPRFYDGFDLTTTEISIYWVNENGAGSSAIPVDVYHSTDKIRFAWLVDDDVTAKAGKIKFEIQASGKNSKGFNYLWKTKCNDGINVIQALEIKQFIEPDDTWQESFIRNLSAQATKAENARIKAEKAAQDAQEISNSLRSDLRDAAAEVIGEDYYNKREVDNKIANVQVDLTGYATETYVKEKMDTIPSTYLNGYARMEDVPKKVSELVNDKNYLTEIPEEYVTESELEAKKYLTEVPEEYVTDEELNAKGYLTEHQSLDNYATTTYVDSAVAAVDVSEQLADYAKKDTVYTKQEVDEAVANVQVDLSGYYTKSEVDTKTAGIETNTSNISSLSTTLTGLQETVNGIDKSPRKTYDVAYNDTEDPEVGENAFVFYEIENEGLTGETREIKKKFTIVGGSGGGTSSVLKIEYITTSPIVATLNDKVIIKYNFSGTDSSGDPVTDGSATWKVGGRIVATTTAISGENDFDITEYLSIGTQKVNLSVVDDAGSLVTKTWTVQKVDVRIDSTFNDKLTYVIGPVSFDYTPYGAISKNVHFVLDGKELDTVTTSASGIPMSYTIKEQTHGAHLLEVYMTATINGNNIESNHIYKDILFYDVTSRVPIIGCTQQKFTALQYDSTNITYTVYDPTTETPVVTLAVDGNIVSTLTLDNNTQIWQYKSSDVGNHVLTITCRDTVKTINATIEKLDIDITPITAGLAFDFNPSGKSNNDADRLWSDGDVTMTVSDNFDWINGGYQIDDNGDQYFGIKAGTSAIVSYNLFADDARRNGKEFKLIFKTSNVAKSDATFLTCQSSGIGLQMNVHEAYIRANAKSLYVPYSEEDIIEWEFNIAKDTDIPIVMSYEDGTPCRPMSYTSDYSFTQETTVPITIGSPDCDIMIYRMKAYNTSLSSTAILTNFIADARTATEMLSRYRRNQIYDENNSLTPESVAEACPDMRIIKIDAPYFTNDKKDFVRNTSMECIYKNGDPILDNWKFTNAIHAGQGTTSNEYGAAGRNIDVICCFDGVHQVNSKIPLDPTYKTELTLGDGTKFTDGTGKISLTRDSVPNNWWNFKVNIASSEMENNALLQKRFNTYLPYSTPATKRDPKIKNDMEFVNCVIFIKESDPDVTQHREFRDTEWHFYALGNMGDSKKTDITRAYDPDDMNEFCIEVSDNTLPNSIFQTGVLNSDGSMKYPITKDEWVAGNTAYDALYNDWDGSFEFRYDCCGDSKDGEAISTNEVKEQIRTNNKQIWRDFYEFVITSSDSEFVNNLKNWFIVDSALYFYLFTLRYTMIDNRAKNTFWHWAKHYISTSEAETLGDKATYYTVDDDAAAINNGYRFDLWNYDNDSALGINNSGELTMTYGKEDTDYRTEGDSSSGYTFNAAESVFFCRIRDLMNTQLRSLYTTCESQNCWSATSLINQWDKAQNEWPEELWRLDYVRKYERTYRDGGTNTRYLEQMMNGKKKYQRRQFERDQEMYMATKFIGTTATSDQIMFRCNTPINAVVKPDYTLHLTPFSDMYLSVMFGNSSPTQIRAKAGKQYNISCPYETMDDTAVLIYGASRIQSMGDISACYIHDNDFSKAIKLKELIIGNATQGYQNQFLTNIGIGNNALLEKLDIQNTPNLAQALDLSKCNNLKELYAYGSGLTGITLADGGLVKVAQLPALIALTVKNLIYLTDFNVASFDNLTTIVAENCNIIDVKNILTQGKNINRVRIIGIDWSMDNATLLDKIYAMAGIDKSGYNINQSVLTGKVHVASIKQKQLENYKSVWPDLEITYNTLVAQYTVKFLNKDESILDIQYVDKGEKPVDPITRDDNPIQTPTLASTISTDYTFNGWDSEFFEIFTDTVFYATYSETIREYTVRYISYGNILQETRAPYGTLVSYTQQIPTYTIEESAYRYYLFDHWDQSGFVTGDKTINAVYDSCEYNAGYFEDKDISTMRPVEIYAMTQLGLESQYVESKDVISVELGNDISYSDIQEKILVSTPTVFNGSNYIDTQEKLFSEDRDFILAIDYTISQSSANGNVFTQCYSDNGMSGFRLWYNNGVKLGWGNASMAPANAGEREMLVLRHIKGENGIHVYTSNIEGDEPAYIELDNTHSAIHDNTLVFGCSKADDGAYESYGTGTVYWSKIWYADLGDDACKNLAYWPHEVINCEMSGFKRYYLSNSANKRCSMTFLASTALSRQMALNKTASTEGGWADFALNNYLNNRLYNAVSVKWKQLIKQVKVISSIGNKSTNCSSSNCYIYIPAVIELDATKNIEPYYNEIAIKENMTIDYMSTNAARILYDKSGNAVEYWTRSPNISYDNYIWFVRTSGATHGFDYPSSIKSVRIMFSI